MTHRVSNRRAEVMDFHEKLKIRSAAFKALRLYPGVVGEVLSRELLSWEDFGYRLRGGGSVNRLVQHIETTPIPIRVPVDVAVKNLREKGTIL